MMLVATVVWIVAVVHLTAGIVIGAGAMTLFALLWKEANNRD